MDLDGCIKRIEKYLGSDKHTPIIVDSPNASVLRELRSHFAVGKNKLVRAEHFAKDDQMPFLADIKAALTQSNDTVFLDGFSYFLLLQGERALTNELNSMLALQPKGKLVILTYSCAKFLMNLDNRLHQSGRITIIDGTKVELPTLNLVSSNLPKPEASLSGINQLARLDAFLVDDTNEVNVVTSHRSKDYPNSCFPLQDYTSNFQVISGMCPDLEKLGKESGTEALWGQLVEALTDYDSWAQYANSQFGNVNQLHNNLAQFGQFSNFKKWVYFISLRIFGAGNNSYLSSVISKSETFDDFIANSFTHILTLSHKSVDYWTVYRNRKLVVAGMQSYTDAIDSFRKQAYGKGKDALYYMTDLNKEEKEQTIDLLDRYGKTMTVDEIVAILKNTYPALSLYLAPYFTGNDYLDKYFELYKYGKVSNIIPDELREMVEYQAKEHEFLELLKPRSYIIDSLNIDGNSAILYFMDALGVEFLSYIQNKCYENGLTFQANVARCDLPSITSINKTFVNDFKAKGCKVIDNRSLDTIKHEGESSYNFENVRIPIHIVEELNIIDKLIEQLKKLSPGVTAYIVSDHGASRLAVINETETKWSVSEKGKHSGRCCPKSDIDEKPDLAIEENDFWSLANYDRFKGGRKALVEVHGGATLEEVAVPIIKIQKQKQAITCKVAIAGPILVSFKKKAQMTIYVSAEDCEVSIAIKDKLYTAVKTDMPYHYSVCMPDITKAGTYKFNVLVNGSIACKDLTFEVKKEGASERKFF